MTEGGSQGLFVVVAVIIFGLFVSIAYLLFDDTLKPALVGIFKDGLFQAQEKLPPTGAENLPEEDDSIITIVDGVDEDEELGIIYAKLREKDSTKGWSTEVWVKLKIVNPTSINRYYRIVASSTVSLENGDNFGSGKSTMVGDLTIPTHIRTENQEIIPIYEISPNAFQTSRFSGDFFSDGVKTIKEFAFQDSTFTSYSAKKLEKIERNAFYNSKFKKDTVSSEFNSHKIKDVGEYAFYKSEFTGEFIANNLKTLGTYSFHSAKFKGAIEVEKLEFLDHYALTTSSFTGSFVAINLQKLGANNFNNSVFTGDLIIPSLDVMSTYNFHISKFEGVFHSIPSLSMYLYSTDKLKPLGNSSFKKCNMKVGSSFTYTCDEVDSKFVPEGFGLK